MRNTFGRSEWFAHHAAHSRAENQRTLTKVIDHRRDPLKQMGNDRDAIRPLVRDSSHVALVAAPCPSHTAEGRAREAQPLDHAQPPSP